MTELNRVIIITGTPGVGKTTVSIRLATELNAIPFNLASIVKQENLVLGADKKRDSLVVDMEKLSKSIKEKIQASTKDVIVEGHYAPDVIPSNLASHVFVLRRNPDDLKEKLEERGFDRKKVAENVAAEILDVCLVYAVDKFGLKKVSEIDTSNRTIENVVSEILRILKGEEEMFVGKVNWLGKIEAEGRLEDFLDRI